MEQLLRKPGHGVTAASLTAVWPVVSRLALAKSGEEVVIQRSGRPLVRLVLLGGKSCARAAIVSADAICDAYGVTRIW